MEDGDAENQHRDKPTEWKLRTLGANLQAQSSHEEAQKHGPAIAHENFRGIEVPAQKPESSTERGGTENADERLTAQNRRKREECGRNSGNARAQAVHMIQNAEGSRDANDPEDGQGNVENSAGWTGDQLREQVRSNAGND